MQAVVVEHHNNGNKRTFEGDDAVVRDELLDAYNWLLTKYGPHASVETLVKALDSAQAYTAVIHNGDVILKSEDTAIREGVLHDMLGQHKAYDAALAAAKFLAGGSAVLDPRRCLVQADGDVVAAALLAFGLPVAPDTIASIRAVLEASGSVLAKADPEAPALPVKAEPATPDAAEFAEAINRSFKAKDAFHVKLGGKHSSGSILARDPESQVSYLLKPGSGPQSPALGAREEEASQAKREAAAWAAAQICGVAQFLSEAHLVLLDDKEFAAMKLLPWSFKSALRLQQDDPNAPRRLFGIYLPDGTLHRLAAFDYIIGQTDRHAGNIMTRGADIKLIDHGAAFAGPDFNPALDQMSFVPFYLRALAPANFGDLPPGDKLKALPRIGASAESNLRKWLGSIDTAKLISALQGFGVDPDPSISRLRSLQAACGHTPADLAVNGAWVLP